MHHAPHEHILVSNGFTVTLSLHHNHTIPLRCIIPYVPVLFFCTLQLCFQNLWQGAGCHGGIFPRCQDGTIRSPEPAHGLGKEYRLIHTSVTADNTSYKVYVQSTYSVVPILYEKSISGSSDPLCTIPLKETLSIGVAKKTTNHPPATQQSSQASQVLLLSFFFFSSSSPLLCSIGIHSRFENTTSWVSRTSLWKR